MGMYKSCWAVPIEPEHNNQDVGTMLIKRSGVALSSPPVLFPTNIETNDYEGNKDWQGLFFAVINWPNGEFLQGICLYNTLL